MVRQLDKLLDLNMRHIDIDSDEAAFKQVQADQVYAAFTLAGWPHGQVKRLMQSSGLTLARFDMPIGGPYRVLPVSYRNMGVYNVQARCWSRDPSAAPRPGTWRPSGTCSNAACWS